jgi:phosphopantetheine--protein transferase-like protein
MSRAGEMRDEIRGMIATMLMVAPAEMQDGSSLAALNTSLGSARLRLGLKRLGLALPAGAAPATFGGLLAALEGNGVAVATEKVAIVALPAVTPVVRGAAGLQVGLDVEEIGALPAASDYWEHEFYRGSFARAEIAYAVQQPEPRVHLAGFWCAKEALRKCDPLFAKVEFCRIAVAHDASGQPYLTLDSSSGTERLLHAVSISHTADVAAAVVVLGGAASAEVVEMIAPVLAEEIAPAKRKSRGLAKLFGI